MYIVYFGGEDTGEHSADRAWEPCGSTKTTSCYYHTAELHFNNIIEATIANTPEAYIFAVESGTSRTCINFRFLHKAIEESFLYANI